MTDLILYENGNGGDLQLKGNDLATTDGLTNQPYLAWFGGNLTDDWWGNKLLLTNDKSIQFTSYLENLLQNTALNSDGRNRIENFIKKDLEFLRTFVNIETSVSIISDDKLQIVVKLTKPDSLNNISYSYIWDATQNELIEQRTL